MKATDGKRRTTDVANAEQLLHVIQFIQSKKTDPFKLWLAQIGRERIEETLIPELIADRLIQTYERKGYTREWINQRLIAISARKNCPTNGKTAVLSREKNMPSLQMSSQRLGLV